MTIIDREVIGEGSDIPYEIPNLPLGIYLDDVLQRNIAQHGDAKWLVNILNFIKSLINHFF